MPRRYAVPLLLSLLLALFPFRQLLAADFLYGIDVLQRSGFSGLERKNVGLITNAAGVDVEGRPNYRILLQNGVKLRFLMSPEHGFAIGAEAGETVGDRSLDEGLTVYSLYGATKKPDRKLLDAIDILLFDLQDIGARCYTYISTMREAMEACEEAGVAFMVLDRPNPISPIPAEGFMLDPGYSSFVGSVPVPFLHSMTVGEIAVFLKKRYFPGIDLRVVGMEGYSRKRFADEFAGFRFVPPSPNIRDPETALVYPSTVFFEAANVSEGRGTGAPFRQFGAPYIDPARLKNELESARLPGVAFTEVEFVPESGRFKGLACKGLRVNVTDRYVFEPFRTGVTLLVALQKLYPRLLGLDENGDFFDKLAGTPLLRKMVVSERTVEEILAASRLQVHAFEQENPDRFLYE